MQINRKQAALIKTTLKRGFIAVCFGLFIAACHIRGGEPSGEDISDAYRTELDRINAAGLDTLTLTATGKTMRVETKLDNLEKLSCSGKDFVYVCEVKAWMRYPLQDMAETHKLSLTIFDGPEGWQFVEGKLLDRLEWSK